MTIKIAITKEDIELCLDFSTKIILGDDQYDRVKAENDVRIQRTCAGKIGELAYLKYIRTNINSNYPEGDMFKIFKGQEKTDKFDFKTTSGKTVDVKTAYLPNSRNIVISNSQFNNSPKDYYVGVKLNASFLNPFDKNRADLYSITEAEIKGVLDREKIKKIISSNQFGPSARYCDLKKFEKDELKY